MSGQAYEEAGKYAAAGISEEIFESWRKDYLQKAEKKGVVVNVSYDNGKVSAEMTDKGFTATWPSPGLPAAPWPEASAFFEKLLG